MKFFKKLKSSNFWVSMVSAVVLILQAVFNVDIKTEYLSQIIMGMLGVLVMTGIVSDSPSAEANNKQDLNIDNITQSLGKIFTQTIAGIESNMLSIVTQFEKINNSSSNQKVESVEHDLQVKEHFVESETLTQDSVGVVANDNMIICDNPIKDVVQDANLDVKQELIVDSALIEQQKNIEEVKTSNLNVL